MAEAGSAPAFGQLARELNLTSDADSTAIISSLLNFYTRSADRPAKDGEKTLQEGVRSPDLVCHVALKSATAWVCSSPERADALVDGGAILQQMGRLKNGHQAKNQAALPYAAGLQLLLRICINSSRACQVRTRTLFRMCLAVCQRPAADYLCMISQSCISTRTRLVLAVQNAEQPEKCPADDRLACVKRQAHCSGEQGMTRAREHGGSGLLQAILGDDALTRELAVLIAQDGQSSLLAAAVLNVCLLQLPQGARTASSVILQYTDAFFEHQLAQQNGELHVPGDAFYLVANLAHIAAQHMHGDAGRARRGHLVLQLWPAVLASGHLLAASMALTLMAASMAAGEELADAVLEAGAVEKVRRALLAAASTN